MPPNWIDQVMQETEHVETPRSWLWWSLCCAISAAAGNNYYLPALKGAVIVKPNLFVILLGESGLGKEFPISLATEMVDKADVTRVIAGRSSIQAIVKELSITRSRPDGGDPIMDSRAFIVNGELSTAIISDPDALTILTDLYDRKVKWGNLLKGDGEEKLKNPYITALFGSSPAHFYESIPQVNIEGGYVGRNLIVFEERRAKDTDLLDDEVTTDEFPFGKFVKHLQDIQRGSGRIIPTPDAKEYFNIWRREWRQKAVHDKTGFNNRVPVHALKVAMCLCLADAGSLKQLLITQDMMELAIDMVVSLVYSNKRTTELKGPDPLAAPTKLVLDFLLTAKGNELKRRTLLSKGYGHYDTVVLDKVLDNLLELKWVERDRYIAGSNTDWIIKLSGEPLEQYRKYVEAKRKGA